MRFQNAAVDGLHDDLGHGELKAGDVDGEGLAALQRCHGAEIVVHARADGVVVQRQPGGLGRSPQRLPGGVEERCHLVGIGHLDAAQGAAFRHPLHFPNGGFHVVAGNVGQAGEAFRVCRAEIR